MTAMEATKLTRQQAGKVDVREVTLQDVQAAHAFRHGDRLMIVIGDEVFALPRNVASELAWDMCSQLKAMSEIGASRA